MTIVRVVTGIRVERRVLRLPPGFSLGDPVCVDDPEDCCDEGSGSGSGSVESTTSPCCPDATIPLTLYGVFSSVSEPCIDGYEFAITYDPDVQEWRFTLPDSVCGAEVTYLMRCDFPQSGINNWFFGPTFGVPSGVGEIDGEESSCDPVYFVFPGVRIVTGAGVDLAQVIVTETPP